MTDVFVFKGEDRQDQDLEAKMTKSGSKHDFAAQFFTFVYGLYV